MIRLLRQIRRIVSVFAVTAILLWGVAAAAAPEHESIGAQTTTSGAAITGHVHGADVAPGSCDDDSAGGFDRCCPPGCSFSAMTPIPVGTVVHAFATAPVLAPNSSAPTHAAAPPLRPPRVS